MFHYIVQYVDDLIESLSSRCLLYPQSKHELRTVRPLLSIIRRGFFVDIIFMNLLGKMY